MAEKESRDVKDSFAELDCTEIAELIFSPLHHQAIEWNADDFSATFVIEMIFCDSSYWKRPHVSFANTSQLFWVVANATLVSYSLLGSNKRLDNLEHSSHLPAKFRAFAYVNTASKTIRKSCGFIESTRAIVEEAIDLIGRELDLNDFGYKAILSESEGQVLSSGRI